MRRYAFLDRDGTLVAERPDAEWRGVTELTLLPGVGQALRRLQVAYDLVVLTNQYLIDEGRLGADDYQRQTTSLIAALMDEGVGLLDVLHCPHARMFCCGCRKPSTGLVVQTVRRHGPVDGAGSIVVGDSAADAGLARAVGLPGYLIGARPATVPAGVAWVRDFAGLVAHLGL